ncbi:hypothetical protein PCASD_05866 [Puccinia coronata f. sp. avenae]|uniref:Uncharacterized protein n=1 Tax=Puccinia coronata f. sp. avenae TaxID=200324 RepID=A0A2N5V406_9BASI|nr:hypothetical protein PCASD_14082 [Puccinia coronata f. sp. avenae]PLW44731.1 hypothetical protein PCASD_05866 [Puccinia coronata f. sp. avenae]
MSNLSLWATVSQVNVHRAIGLFPGPFVWLRLLSGSVRPPCNNQCVSDVLEAAPVRR